MFGAKTFCAFGTYSVDDAKKLLITRIASCSAAKLTGTGQNRDIMLLTADEFKYSNPVDGARSNRRSALEAAST